MNLQAFTDGASSPDGRGGWAYVVVEDDIEILRGRGSALGVTHQRMEIRAVAEALLAAPKTVPLTVVGDSAYVIDCFLKGWHVTWEANGWRNYSNKPVANREEWERLIAAWRAREAETTWQRVKGHNGHRWNEIADALAVEAKGSANPTTAADPPEMRAEEADTDWFWEGNVQNAVVTFLRSEGWRIVGTADTASKQRGVDILADKEGRTLIVEVKGWPKDRGRTAPTNQAYQWFAHALRSVALLPNDYPDAELALAFPDTARYRKLSERSRWMLDRLGVGLYLVAQNGVVHRLLEHDSAPLRRAADPADPSSLDARSDT